MAAETEPLKETPGPLSAIPCKDSDHHSYLGIPRRGTEAAVLDSCPIFSGSVRCETREIVRCLIDKETLQKG